MKIDTLIKVLREYRKLGNLDIWVSSDEEGNSYGEMDKEYSFSYEGTDMFINPVNHKLPEEMNLCKTLSNEELVDALAKEGKLGKLTKEQALQQLTK